MTNPQPQRKPATPDQINRQQGYQRPSTKAEATHAVVPAKTAAPATNNKTPAPASTAVPSTAVAPVFNQEAFERNLSLWGRGGETPLMHNGLEGSFRSTGGEVIDVADTIFVAHLNQTRHDWIRFHGEGSPPRLISVGIYEAATLPDRTELGDNDKTLWEKDRFRDEPIDPWQEQYRVPIVSTDDSGEVFELTSRSTTSRFAIQALIDRYGRHPQRRKGKLPLIKLVDTTYFNKKFGRDMPKPLDQIVGWVDGDDPVTKPATPQLPFHSDPLPF